MWGSKFTTKPLHVLDRGAQADARGATHVLDRSKFADVKIDLVQTYMAVVPEQFRM